MRTLLALSIVMMGFAATAEAHKSGYKTKSVEPHAGRSNLGFNKQPHDRRSAVGTHYTHQEYPIWAARAFQPPNDR